MITYELNREESFIHERVKNLHLEMGRDSWKMSTVLHEAGKVSVEGSSLTHIAKVSFMDVPYIDEVVSYDEESSIVDHLVKIEDSLIRQDGEMISAGFRRSFKGNGKETRFTSYEIDFKTDDENYPLLTFHFTRSRITTPNDEISTIVIHVDPYIYHGSAYNDDIVEVMKKFFLNGEYCSMMSETVLKRDEVESLHLIPEKLRDFLIKGEAHGQ